MQQAFFTDGGTSQYWSVVVDCEPDQWPSVRQKLCAAVDELVNRQLDRVEATPKEVTCLRVPGYDTEDRKIVEGVLLQARVRHSITHTGQFICGTQLKYDGDKYPSWKENWKKPFAEVEPGEVMQLRRVMIDLIRRAAYKGKGVLDVPPPNMEAAEPADQPFVRVPKPVRS